MSVNPDRASEFTDNPVYVAGFGVATDHPYLHEKDSFTEIKATRLAAERAYAMAGIAPSDVDCAEVHDCFTIPEILDIEDLGFVEKGDGGRATVEGVTALDGRLPVNTSGASGRCPRKQACAFARLYEPAGKFVPSLLFAL